MTTKLLAVDDSKTMRRVLEITFSGEEFHTTILGSADEALAAVKANPPHVALVDGHLGASSGYDLCRAIKQVAPATRVIIMSSKQRPYDEGAGSSVGADGSFDKPFDSTKMIARIAEEAAHAGPIAAAPPAPSTAARLDAPRPMAPVPMATAPEPPMRPGSAPATASTAARRPPAPAPIASAAPPRATIAGTPASAAAAVVPLSAGAAAGLAGKLEGLGLTREQVAAVLSLSREVVEQAVWEVVPVLAETLIKEEIARLTAE